MPQEVMIHADSSAVIGLNKKMSQPADTSAAETFSTELDKQVKASYSNDSKNADIVREHEPESDTRGDDTAKSEVTEKTATEDGNNLPTVSADETDEAGATGLLPQRESSDAIVAGETAEEDNSSIRAQVSVSQHAVDHARATPVAMTAKAMPEQAANAAKQGEAGLEKTESAVAKNQHTVTDVKTTPVTNPVEQSKATNATTENNGQDKKSTLSELAATESGQKDGKHKPAAIRADILEALKRQNGGGQELVATLRNQIHARIQQQENGTSPATMLLNEAVGSESGRLTALTATSTAVSAMMAASTGTAVNPPAFQLPALPIQPSMQSTSWAQVMSSRVVWMAKEGVQQAELRLTPANLGPVEVRLQLHNEQASVTFLAQHAATRDALEQALPRLRESFADAGIQLANAEVGQQRQQHHDEPEQAHSSRIFIQADGQADDIETEAEIEQSSGEPSVGLSLYA